MKTAQRFNDSVTQHIVTIILTIMFLSCSHAPDVAGGSTTVENGYIIATVAVNGSPVESEVQLIPAEYDPLSNTGGIVRTGRSNSNGFVRFDSIPKGNYSLLILNDSLGIYLNNLSINDSVSAVLTKTGTVKLKADPSTAARLIGSPFVGVYNTADSTIEFTNIPAGIYPQLKITGTVTAQADSITVIPSDTVLIDSKEPTLSILSVPVWSTIGGSEIRSISIDPLGRLWVAADYSGYFYQNGSNWSRMPNPDTVNSSDGFWSVRVCPEKIPGSLGITYLINTGKGPILYDDANAADPVVSGSAVTALALGKTGHAAVASDTAVWYHPYGQVWNKIAVNGARSLFCGTDTIWIGTKTGGVLSVELSSGTTQQFSAGSSSVNALIDLNGVKYLGTTEGIFRMNGTTSTPIAGSPDSIGQIVQDSSGVVWAISGSSKLVRYDGTSLEQFAPKNGSLKIAEIVGGKSGVYAACGKEIYRFW